MAHSLLLAKQWALYDGQEFERAWRETRAILDGLHGEDQRDAQRLGGLCCYRLKEYNEATLCLEQACQDSTDSNDWLWLALAATRRGRLEEGAAAFEQVRICQHVAKFSQPPGFYTQIYSYAMVLCDVRAWTRLMPLLDELAKAYARIGSTDTALLYRQGMPFLASLLALAVRLFSEQQQYVQGLAWLQQLALALDDEGKRQASRAMHALREADARGEVA